MRDRPRRRSRARQGLLRRRGTRASGAAAHPRRDTAEALEIGRTRPRRRPTASRAFYRDHASDPYERPSSRVACRVAFERRVARPGKKSSLVDCRRQHVDSRRLDTESHDSILDGVADRCDPVDRAKYPRRPPPGGSRRRRVDREHVGATDDRDTWNSGTPRQRRGHRRSGYVQ